MAVKVALVSVGVLLGVVTGAAMGIHAQPESDMGVGSDLTGVDGSDQAAIPEPTDVVPDPTVETPAPQLPIPHRAQWMRLVGCEAGYDWHNASNRRYSGGLQFDAPTWARYGGQAYAWRADFATPEQQMLVAERTLAVQGWSAWPACSRRLGLR